MKKRNGETCELGHKNKTKPNEDNRGNCNRKKEMVGGVGEEDKW